MQFPLVPTRWQLCPVRPGAKTTSGGGFPGSREHLQRLRPGAGRRADGRGGASPGAVCCCFKELRTQLCRQPQVLKPGGIEVFGMKGKAQLARSLSSQMEGL